MKLRIIAFFIMIASCGTRVDVGRNEEKGNPVPPELQEKKQPEDEITVTEDEFGPADNSGSQNSSNGSPIKLTCFGESPSTPAYLEDFCKNADAEQRKVFATTFDLICEKKKLINLFRNACSYDGEGEQSKYFRILKNTDVKDQEAKEFYFLAGFSVTADSTIEDKFNLIYFGYSDQKAFVERYVEIENAHYYDAVVNKSKGEILYSAELASSAAVASFRGKIKLQRFSDDLAVVYNYSIGDTVVIKEHAYIIFIVKLPDNKTRVVAVDEKLVDDSGNHTIAFQTVLKVAKQRMNMEYENAKLD